MARWVSLRPMRLISGRVILAAAKLAAFYVALVTLELVVLGIAFRVGVPPLRGIGEMAIILSIPFAGAFVLLAIARRWGFVALWGLLAVLWFLSVSASGAWEWSSLYPKLFVPWSILALPLWVIGQAGIPRRSAGLISPSMALLVCWAALLLGVLLFASPRDAAYWHPRSVAAALAWIWAPMPLILSAFAISHVWRGTARPAVVA